MTDVLSLVPSPVLSRVRVLLARLAEVADALEQGANLDRLLGGDRYRAEVADKNATKAADAEAGLAEFRRLAAAKGIDADAVLEALKGGRQQ